MLSRKKISSDGELHRMRMGNISCDTRSDATIAYAEFLVEIDLEIE